MVDMAIGIIIGTSFNAVINSLVNKVIMPPLFLLTNGVNLGNKKYILREASAGIEEVAIGYGDLLNVLIDFLIVAMTIFLVIKDAHDYPLHLNSVEIDVRQNEQTVHRQSWTLDQEMEEREASLEFELTDCPLAPGEVEVYPTLSYTISGKTRELLVDNYRRIAKPPLRIRIAETPLPKLENWFSGDVHLHSSLTDDQVEFGAPLKQIQKAIFIVGIDVQTIEFLLQFVCSRAVAFCKFKE